MIQTFFRTGISASNPYVPLSYSSVDQRKFFKRPEKENIQDILDKMQAVAKEEVKWPFQVDENCVWVAAEQPQTHVQVNNLIWSDVWKKCLKKWIIQGAISRRGIGIKYLAAATSAMVFHSQFFGLSCFDCGGWCRTVPDSTLWNRDAPEIGSELFEKFAESRTYTYIIHNTLDNFSSWNRNWRHLLHIMHSSVGQTWLGSELLHASNQGLDSCNRKCENFGRQRNECE